MWLQKEDLHGLLIGLALGGAALYLLLPRIEAVLALAPPPTSPGQPAAPPFASAPPVVEQFAPPAPVAAIPAPAPLPSIAYPDLSPQRFGARPLPVVIGPSQPPKSAGKAGTGFFIAGDGSLLTAAHVVTDCRRIDIVSRLVKPTAADILASDAKQDIALLRVPHLRPPAILPLGPPVGRRTSHQVFVLGYPTSAGPTIPAETWATLENDKFPASAGAVADPREIVWIEAAAVTHGYSGGPILDPGSGVVVGIVKGMIDTSRLRFVPGMPASGVAAGPGAGRLAAFVREAAPYLDTDLPSDIGDAALDDARRATVHVICWQ